MPYNIETHCSCAIPELARVVHTHLNLKVLFNRKVLSGIAILTIERTNPLIQDIILDTYQLNIIEVTDCNTGAPLRYDIGLDYYCGKKFIIKLPSAQETNKICKVQIEYETSPKSPALHWLIPKQTFDGTHPFLLSNSKYIYARAMFPCQDTPSVKFTYTAKILVPKNFTVIMSALFQGKEIYENYQVQYEFYQPTPIPSYAVVIAVGSLLKAEISSRSSVFAEHKLITESIKTFTKIEIILQVAELLCGPYFGGKYDVCVLPPCMAHFEIVECPCVTFVSPTLLGGDISLVSSLARNIAQNWAGVLVTCADYNNLWLNKSLSIYIYRRILQKIMFKEMQEFFKKNIHFKIEEHIAKSEKNGALQSSQTTTNYTLYEKKCIFLEEKLEECVGGPTMFDQFLKSYFVTFAHKSITANAWKDYLYQYFPDKIKSLELLEWKNLFETESHSPTQTPLEMTPFVAICFDLANEWERWDESKDGAAIPHKFLDVKNFHDVQKIIFFNCLYKMNLTATKIKLMSTLYEFHIHNNEIRFHWIRLCMKNRWKPMFNIALNFAMHFSAPRYTNFIFEDICEWEEMRPHTIEAYKRDEGKLLHETRGKLKSILQKSGLTTDLSFL